jgi:hypothetical protein
MFLLYACGKYVMGLIFTIIVWFLLVLWYRLALLLQLERQQQRFNARYWFY